MNSFYNCSDLIDAFSRIRLALELGATSPTVAAACTNYTAFVQCVAQTYPLCLDAVSSGLLPSLSSFNCSDSSMLNSTDCASVCQVALPGGGGVGGSTATSLAIIAGGSTATSLAIIAGSATAAGGGLVLCIGVVVLVVCLKRRKSREVPSTTVMQGWWCVGLVP
jgi:hypothetical protein